MSSTNQWDDLASSWDEREDVRAYAARALAFLHDHAADLLGDAGLRILDFGAGTGLLTQRLAQPGREIVAVDLSERMLSVLARKQLVGVTTRGLDLVEDDAAGVTELGAGSFGLIVASSACAFVGDFGRLLATFRALLRPGGRFVQWDWEKQEGSEDVGFTQVGLREAYVAAGLEPLFVGPAFEMTIEGQVASVLAGVATRVE